MVRGRRCPISIWCWSRGTWRFVIFRGSPAIERFYLERGYRGASRAQTCARGRCDMRVGPRSRLARGFVSLHRRGERVEQIACIILFCPAIYFYFVLVWRRMWTAHTMRRTRSYPTALPPILVSGRSGLYLLCRPGPPLVARLVLPGQPRKPAVDY
jgi:hypothetical protein